MMTGFLHGRGYKKGSFKDVVFVGDVEKKYWEALRNHYLELRTDARLFRQTRFHLVGSIISEKAMREYYGMANFTVVNSNCEAFGRGILESFAHGIPVLARGCGGPAEIIKHGKTGFLFSTGMSIMNTIGLINGPLIWIVILIIRVSRIISWLSTV